MTLNEYANKISQKIINSPYSYEEIISEAERVLESSKISAKGKKQFWIDLFKLLEEFFKIHSSFAFESQDSSELSKVVEMAKLIIAKKAS
ncbi:hypothetical protein ACW7GX_11505 [Aeromonas hydrophila]